MKKTSFLLSTLMFVLCSFMYTTEMNAGIVRSVSSPWYLSTDKCMYSPGERVVVRISGDVPSGARIRIHHGSDVMMDEAMSGKEYVWTAPSADYRGYMADIYVKGGNGDETIYGAIAIDVSSTWKRFPRYGFVATYDDSKTKSTIEGETAFLNRCHINGIQYYDWQYLHEIPYDKWNHRDSWTDLANRTIRASVVRDYISEHHRYGMKAMFYNLLFGADPGYGDRGVSWDWGMFKDGEQDFHPLPDNWRGPIYLCDPSNKSWQNYLIEKNNDVYEAFDFDGYHIDQLGYRGDRYNNSGDRIDLPVAYKSFINAMKTAHPDKLLVMNGVSNYGGSEIVSTGKMEFSYTELWSDDDSYQEMERLVREHAAVNDAGTASVFAAYMNYDVREEVGRYFNTPGILLTDATMFAVGGSHLELGDGHLLCSEYFPHKNLLMSDDLKSKLTTYYDFMTAYENLLRDGGEVVDAGITCTNNVATINSWPPATGRVVAYSRQKSDCKVVSLLNFSSASEGKHLTCRDLDGDMPEPALKENMEVRILAPKTSRVWMASPDRLGGVPQELDFIQDGEYVTLTVPSLKYWTMLVIEQDNPVVLKSTPMIVGEAVYCGWNEKNAVMMQRTDAGSNVFTYTGWLTADKDFKFITECNWTSDEYRNANGSDAYISGDGLLQLNGDDNKFKVSESANYTITVDLDNMTINVTRAAYQSNPIYYNVLYLVGDNTPGGWDLTQATPMVQDADNPFLFKAQLHMSAPAGGSFKIMTNPNSGYPDSEAPYAGQKVFYRDASNYYAVSDDATDDRKWSVSSEDDYMIRVDLQSHNIDIWRAINIGPLGVATYCCDRQLDFTGMDDNIKAYVVEGTTGSGTVLGMNRSVVTSVPASTGLLLCGTPGKYFVPTTLRSTDDCSRNMLVGVLADTPIFGESGGQKNYVLGNGSRGVGFYRSQDGTLGANKAYLALPTSSLAKVVVLDDAEITAVQNVVVGKTDNPVFCSLMGIRTLTPQSGVYICNGKKVVVK